MALIHIFLCNKVSNEASHTVITVKCLHIIKTQSSMSKSVCHNLFQYDDYAFAFLFPIALKISLSAAEYVNFAHLIYLPDLKYNL